MEASFLKASGGGDFGGGVPFNSHDHVEQQKTCHKKYAKKPWTWHLAEGWNHHLSLKPSQISGNFEHFRGDCFTKLTFLGGDVTWRHLFIRTIGPWFLWIHICPTPPKKKKKKNTSSPDALVSSKKTPVNKHWYETCWNMLKRFQLINYICSVEPEDTVKQTHQDSITENFQTLCVHWEEESHFGSNWSLFLPDIWIFSQTHLQNKNIKTNKQTIKQNVWRFLVFLQLGGSTILPATINQMCFLLTIDKTKGNVTQNPLPRQVA